MLAIPTSGDADAQAHARAAETDLRTLVGGRYTKHLPAYLPR